MDNYQGEENDIVILSCVRYNDQDKIGHIFENNTIHKNYYNIIF